MLLPCSKGQRGIFLCLCTTSWQMKSESSKSVRISQKIAPMPSAYCRAFRTGKGADRPASEKSPFCTDFIGRSSALLLRKESTDERSIPRFPLFETALCLGSAFFPPCETFIRWITDDFPPCETVLHEGSADFPPCETFVGWVMKEFPCRKVVRDGYEVHCLPAIRLETVTDVFLAVAIGLEMFTEEIATLTKQLVKLTEEIATLQRSP